MKYVIMLVIPMIVIEGKVLKFGKVHAPADSGPAHKRILSNSGEGESNDSHNLRFAKWAGVPKAIGAASTGSDNTDTITSVQAIYYIGPVEIGSQTFQVIYDTGSNMIWVPSSACSSTDCGSQTTFSGTSTSANQDFDLTYGSGSVSGSMVYTTVTLADATVSSFKVGLADSVGFAGFSTSSFDGILGLAWPGLNSDLNVLALVPTLYAANQIQDDLFSIYLDSDGSNGELNLGEIDTTRYQGDIQWMPLVTNLWWTINLVNAYLGDVNANATSSIGNQRTIIDSGTSLIIGPTDQVDALMLGIQNSGTTVYYDESAGLYAVYCSAVSSLPDLTFVLAGSDGQSYHFTMPGATYVVATLSSNPNICPIGIQGSGSITSLSSTNINWILGDPFLRTFYTIYDYGEERIGVAAAYPSAGTTIPGQKFKSAQIAGLFVSVFAMLLI